MAILAQISSALDNSAFQLTFPGTPGLGGALADSTPISIPFRNIDEIQRRLRSFDVK
jgi:hypothetical protein